MALRHWTGHQRSLAALIALAMSLAIAAGCGPAERRHRSDAAGVTIAGVIVAPERSHAVARRVIQAVNMDTGALTRGTTSHTGGYEVSVPPGRYRVDIVLLPGESILAAPDIVHADRAGEPVRADFVLGTTTREPRRLRPRQPAVLGAPSA